MVHDSRLRNESSTPALLAERISIQFDLTQAAPTCRLIKSRVGTKATALCFPRRQIAAA